MATEAEKLTEAQEDVERIAADLFGSMMRRGFLPEQTWLDASDMVKDYWRGIVTELLHRDVVRVGRRPQRGDPPMDGQTELTDEFGMTERDHNIDSAL